MKNMCSLHKHITVLNTAYALFLAHAAYIVTLLWSNLDLLSFDKIGHIASAKTFSEGYFHTFNDTFFQGNIQNLFYPPLQDALITLFSFITPDFITAYYVYVSVFIFPFFATCIYFTRNFSKTHTKILFLATVSLTLFISKTQQNFMGLGWYDVFVYGLFNQILGFIFLLFLIDGLLQQKDWKILVLFTSLAALSHLVIGITAFGTLTVYTAINLSTKGLRTIMYSLGVISFFLIPFIWYKEYMISNIILEPLPAAFILALISLIPTITSNKKYSFILLSAVFLALPGALLFFVNVFNLFQTILTTHYTRFVILSLWFIILYTLFLIDNVKSLSPSKNISLILTLIFLILTFNTFEYYNPSTEEPEVFDNTSKDFLDNISTNGKIHTIEHDRTIDFQIDNYIAIKNPSTMFTKGLFWESTRNNNLLNSFITTLYSTEGAMLYHHFLTSPSCQQIQCIYDQFITDYAIQKIIVSGQNTTLDTAYLSPSRNKCYKDIFQEDTYSYSFQKTKEITSNKRTYTVYNVSPTKNITNAMVDVPRHVKTHRVQNDPWGFMPATTSLYETCGQIQQPLYLREEHTLPNNITQQPTNTTFKKVGKATYNITVEADNPTIFRIKLNYLPGLTLQKDGEELPLYDATHYMVGVGNGDMQLTHKTPKGFIAGYLVTTLTLLLILWNSKKPIKVHVDKLRETVRNKK